MHCWPAGVNWVCNPLAPRTTKKVEQEGLFPINQLICWHFAVALYPSPLGVAVSRWCTSAGVVQGSKRSPQSHCCPETWEYYESHLFWCPHPMALLWHTVPCPLASQVTGRWLASLSVWRSCLGEIVLPHCHNQGWPISQWASFPL